MIFCVCLGAGVEGIGNGHDLTAKNVKIVGLLCTGSTSLLSMQAPDDSRLVNVIGRHLHFYAIACSEANESFAHFPGNGCQHEMPVVEFDAKHRSGQDQFHGALDFDRLLFQ